jgi:hypothetical protein
MIRAVEKVRERLLRATAALEKAGLPYAVVGGNAVAAWVSRVDESAVRNTRDVDVLLRRSDLAAARTALESAGFTYRKVAMLGQPAGLDLFLDAPEGSARDAVHIVFATEKARPESPASSPDVIETEAGDPFRLIQLEPLVRMKLTAFRDKDRTHLRDLIEVGLVNADWIDRYSGELKERLRALIETPEG